MSKQRISAREAVHDIRSGMSDRDLMKKYQLTTKGLDSLLRKLVEAKLLEEKFITTRPHARPVGANESGSTVSIPGTTPLGPEKLPDLHMKIARDIKDGVHGSEIMRRYELSPGRLKEIKASLIASGLLDGTDIDGLDSAKTKRCPFCSHEIKESASRCIHCNGWLEPAAGQSAPGNVPVGPGPEAYTGDGAFEDDKECPWEERQNYGTLSAYFQTATKCLLTPTVFFSRLPTRGGYWNPILFGAMSAVVSVVLAYIWTRLLAGGGMGLFGLIIGAGFVFIGALIFVPVALGIWSAIVHACLYLVGGASEGYETTFRVVSYSTVTGVFNAIPIVGTLASLWGFVLTVIGLRETHKTTTGKASAAVLIPLGIGILIAVMAVVVGGSMLRSHLTRQLTSQESAGGKLPSEVCAALETYMAKVNAVRDLDSESAKTEFSEAANELKQALKPFRNRELVGEAGQIALAYGLATLAGDEASQAIAAHRGGPELLRAELEKMCSE